MPPQRLCLGQNEALLLRSRPCRSPFATVRRACSGYRGRCRADSNSANRKQSVKDQLGDEVLRKLRQAEEEAASLREQLAEAKAKAKVTVCHVLPPSKPAVSFRFDACTDTLHLISAVATQYCYQPAHRHKHLDLRYTHVFHVGLHMHRQVETQSYLMTLSNSKNRLQNRYRASLGPECAEKVYLEEVNQIKCFCCM